MNHESTYRSIAFSPGVFMVALVAMLVPWATYVQLAPLTTPVTVLVVAIGLVQLLCIAKKRNKNLDSSVFYFALYIGILLLSRTWTIDTQNWLNAVFWWFICFVSFAGTLWFVRFPHHIRMVAYLSLAGAIIAGVSLEVNIDDWGNVLTRQAVAGHNQNFTAYALSGVVVFVLVSSRLIRFPRWFKLAMPAAILAILYFQMQLGTRGALISSIAAIALHLGRNVAPRLVLRLIPIMALCVSLLAALGFLDVLLGYADSFSERGTGDLSGRTLIWGQAIQFIQQSPIVGIGPGSFQSVNLSGAGAHNFFLIILLETGILGGAIFTIFFGKFFRLFFEMQNRNLGSYLVGIFSAYWFPLVSSGHWETSPLSWIVVALFIRFAYMYRPHEGNR